MGVYREPQDSLETLARRVLQVQWEPLGTRASMGLSDQLDT